jgi:MoaA/NifB/PqqE/SkfB family radical SAM enzyme
MNKWLTIDQIKKFEIELSSYCNARCPLCVRQILGTNQVKPSHVNNHLAFDKIQKLVAQLPDPKDVKFYFAGIGGDPMMHPDIVNIFDYCSKNLRSVSMDTNASLRPKKTWEQLGKISNQYGSDITFSIDGLQDTNAIYRIQTDWNKIMSSARAFIDAGGNAIWKYIVFEHNEHQVEQARDLARGMGFVEFVAENSTRHFENIGPLQPRPPSKVNKNKIKTNIKKNPTIEICCKALELSMMYISNDFKLYPCCYIHNAYMDNPHQIITYMDIDNDLNRQSIAEIIQDKFFQETLIEDWKKGLPAFCAATCNQIKYWDKDYV